MFTYYFKNKQLNLWHLSFLLLSPNNALPGWYSPVKVARVLVVPIKGLGLWNGTA